MIQVQDTPVLKNRILFILACIIPWLGNNYPCQAQTLRQIYPDWPCETLTSLCVSGSDTLFATGLNATILISTNGGANWSLQQRIYGAYDYWRSGWYDGSLWVLPSGLSYRDELLRDSSNLFLLRFGLDGTSERIQIPLSLGVDENSVLGLDLSANQAAAFVAYWSPTQGQSRAVRTTTGGRTWDVVPLPSDGKPSIMNALFFHDARRGHAITAEEADGDYHLYLTNDAGLSWQRANEIQFRTRWHSGWLGYPVSWIDDSSIVAISRNTEVYLSRDYGRTWQLRNISLPAIGISIAMRGSGVGIMVGAGLDVYRTTDFGTTWVALTRQRAASEQSIVRLLKDSTFVIITETGMRFGSSDAGQTWNGQYHEYRNGLLPRYFHNNTQAYSLAMPPGSDLTTVIAGTTDTAKTWRTLNLPEYDAVLGVIPISPTEVLAFRTSTTATGPLVYRTSDAGNTWTSVLASGQPDAALHLNNMRDRLHRGRDTVFLAGREGMYCSSDQGKSWTYYAREGFPRTSDSIWYTMDLTYREYSWSLFGGSIFRSADDGRTWERVLTMPPNNTRLSVLGPKTVAVYSTFREHGAARDVTGTLYHTEDGGIQWSSSPLRGDNPRVRTEGGLNMEGRGIGVLYKNNTIPGGTKYIINMTTDLWRSYTPVCSINERNNVTIVTIDKHDPLVFRGHVIYRLTSYSSTTINYNHTPQQALLGPAYPQPARTRVQVPYTVEHAGTLRFDLYDAMGRHIRTLRAGEESPGSRVLDVDVAGLRAGLYFVRVTTPSGVDVRRISVLP